MTQKLHEKTWNAGNLSWQSVQDPCRIMFENCRCSWNRSSSRSDLKILYFRKIFLVWLNSTRDVTRGAREQNSPGAKSLLVTKKSQQCHKHFFKTAHLLPRDIRFEHRGVKLVSCPGAM